MARRAIGSMAYATYRQRVRRFRRTDLLVAVAALNAELVLTEMESRPALGLPNVVAPFSLGGVARTALVSGNDHRELGVGQQDLVELCACYANIEEPALQNGPGLGRMRIILNHIAYEQLGHQSSPMANVGRTLSLLADHAMHCPTAPTTEDWTQALGVSLEQFMRLGFGMYVTALNNRGCIDRRSIQTDEFSPLIAPLMPDEAINVIDRWFAGTLDELQANGLREEVAGTEKWSLSPLVSRPLVALPDGRYIVPWARLLLDRITPTGLYYIGFEIFGAGFPDALGTMFQEYIGTQLGLLDHAVIYPEIVYGKSSERTVDFFIVTPDVVVLVEVKASRPVWATRLGASVGDTDTANKVGHAFRQIERTAQLIQKGHPALGAIPNDRPLRGLVITLEPFYLVNTDFYHDVLERPSIPTTVASSHEIEGAVAVLSAAPDIGARLLKSLTPSEDGSVASLADAVDGLPDATNPLLDDSWDRFTRPWIEPQGNGA